VAVGLGIHRMAAGMDGRVAVGLGGMGVFVGGKTMGRAVAVGDGIRTTAGCIGIAGAVERIGSRVGVGDMQAGLMSMSQWNDSAEQGAVRRPPSVFTGIVRGGKIEGLKSFTFPSRRCSRDRQRYDTQTVKASSHVPVIRRSGSHQVARVLASEGCPHRTTFIRLRRSRLVKTIAAVPSERRAFKIESDHGHGWAVVGIPDREGPPDCRV
jgi:hypothetical protein